MKTLKTVNSIALVILGITYLAFGARTLFDVEFSDTLIRVFGIMTLVSLPAVVFTTVMLIKNKKN